MKLPEDRDRFRVAADLFLRAVDLPDSQRAEFLESECGDNQQLRDRVSSLLAHHSEGSIYDDTGALLSGVTSPESMLHEPGERASRYQILDRIGEGGMSTVFRAEDATLERVVALKFLAPHLQNNPEALKRFEREAKAAAALEHPNICPVYDIEMNATRPFIAMAFLEGKTLADLLQDRQLDTKTAVEIAIQVCRGLVAAHSKQVVHRDIKPANLMVTEITGSGPHVRILDFGIARLTQKSDITAAGLTMGTVSYIAPEQIEQSLVDGRADLWALGVVLYRMIAGELPFQGDTSRHVIAAIVGVEPKPLRSVAPGVPAALEAIVNRALRKEPEERYQSADEFLDDLVQLRDAITTAAGVPASPRGARTPMPLRSRRILWYAAAAFTVLLVALSISRFSLNSRPISPDPVDPVPFTSLVGAEGDPAISPDGTRIAFTWDGETGSKEPDIYVQLIGTPSLLRITNTPYGEFHPSWSPDGTKIAFIRQIAYETKLVVIPALGGPEREISTADKGSPYASLDWSPRSDLIAVADGARILTISLDDGNTTVLTTPRQTGDWDTNPRFHPTGETIAFERFHADRPTEVMLIPAHGGEPRAIHRSGQMEVQYSWNSAGTALVYAGHRSADGARMRALRVSDGMPVPLRINIENAASPHIRGNRLAYIRRIFTVNVWEAETGLDRTRLAGAASAGTGARRLIASSRRDHSPQFSPDGKTIAFASTRSGGVQIWRSDSEGQNLLQLTSLQGQAAGSPRWSPDGRGLAIDAVIDTPNSDIYLVSANGGVPRRLTQGASADYLPAWSSDGRWVYFCSNREGRQNIWKIPVTGGQEVQVTKDGAWEAIESRDGKYLFYSEPEGPKTIHRLDLSTGDDTAFPQLGNAGAKRYWAVAREGIYFVNAIEDPRSIRFFDFASAEISTVRTIGSIIDYGPPGLAVSPDGKRILWVQNDQDDQDIMLAENFE